VHVIKVYIVRRGIVLLILDLDISSRQRCITQFRHARCTLSRRLGGPQSGFRVLDKTKMSFPGSVCTVKNNSSNCCIKCKVVLCTRWLRELKPHIMGDILLHKIWHSHVSDCEDYSGCILVYSGR